MPPSQTHLHLLSPHLRLFLSLVALAGLAGCGPASTDNSPNLESRASVGGPSAGGKGQGGKQFIPPLASENLSDSTSGKAMGSGRGNSGQGEGPSLISDGKPNVDADGREKLSVPSLPGVPDSIVKGLSSPDVRIRLLALDYWTTSKTTVSLDPLFAALEDEDETVRAKAMEIVEARWVVEQERERK